MRKPNSEALNEKRGQRLMSLDAVKGIGILLVILVHSMRDEMRVENAVLDYLYRAVSVFHMSLFFWISGYLYRKSRSAGKKPVEFLLRRQKKWLIPWGIYVLLIYVMFCSAILVPGAKAILEAAGYSVVPFKKYLLLTLQAVNPYSQHVWFVYVLFLFRAGFYVTDRLTRGARTDMLCLGFLMVSLCVDLGMWYMEMEHRWRLVYYFCLYLPPFVLGIFMQNKRFPKRVIQVWGGLGLVYVLIRAGWFSGFYGNSINAASASEEIVILYMGFALLPGLTLYLCYFFRRNGSAAFGTIKEGLAYLGENSFWIYLFHQPFCCAFLGELLYNHLHLPAVMVMGCCIALSLFFPLACVKTARVCQKMLLCPNERK